MDATESEPMQDDMDEKPASNGESMRRAYLPTKPNLKNFVIDFESINQEMMQNYYDKASIIGYDSKFFSNPASVPATVPDSAKESRILRYKDVYQPGSSFADDQGESLRQSERSLKKEGNSITKYFQKKLAKAISN
mmetsp:Transcript_13259/g.20753  ORF Transcript_13259/g.20753 Transcript_13259/m.20753 type:complete len:136 (+) Transcript_13259:234-641(+)